MRFMYTMHLYMHQDHEEWSEMVQRNTFLLTSSIDLLHFTLDRSHFVSLRIEVYESINVHNAEDHWLVSTNLRSR